MHACDKKSCRSSACPRIAPGVTLAGECCVVFLSFVCGEYKGKLAPNLIEESMNQSPDHGSRKYCNYTIYTHRKSAV